MHKDSSEYGDGRKELKSTVPHVLQFELEDEGESRKELQHGKFGEKEASEISKVDLQQEKKGCEKAEISGTIEVPSGELCSFSQTEGGEGKEKEMEIDGVLHMGSNSKESLLLHGVDDNPLLVKAPLPEMEENQNIYIMQE